MKKYRNQVYRIAPLLMGLVLLAGISTEAGAQAFESLTSLTEIQDAAGKADDRSRQILELMLGDFAQNPLTSIGPSKSLMGALFFIFNACLFAIGSAFIGYQAVVAIAESANHGEVMGKRMSGTWIPIRMGMGIFGMLPVFYGFSLAQAVMLSLAILGIGVANLLTDAAIEMAASHNAIIPPPGLSSSRSSVAFSDAMAESMFVMQICVNANKDAANTFEKMVGGGEPRIEKVRSTTKEAGLFSRGSSGKLWFTNDCGSIILPAYDSIARDDDFWSNRAGYRSSAVNYDSINAKSKAIYAIRNDELIKLFEKVATSADKWYSEFKAGGTPSYPQAEISKLVAQANASEQQRIQEEMESLFTSVKSSLNQEAIDNMKRGGWMTLGAWYATFAESNNALQSAAAVGEIEIRDIGKGELTEIPKVLLEPFEALAAAREKEPVNCILGTRTAIGGCSVGQGIAMWFLETITNNSGGEGMVNPVIASKVIGDHLLATSSTIIAAGWLAGPASFMIEKTPAGRALDVVKKGAKKVQKAVGADKKDSLVGRIASMVLMAMVVLGLIFAVYIPLIPFITWYTALLSYFSSVVEGLVAAQVWAFSHLNSDGEGMGQKTERGYIYMLNMLLRPSLMVMGFFFASSISVLLGTFLFQEIGTAIANAQGNSFTGPMTIFGIIVAVMLMLLTLIQTVFNLIYEVPDRTIAWFGHGMEARMAKEMDRAVEGKMDQSARWGGNLTLMTGSGAMKR